MGGYFFGADPYYIILVLPAFVFALYAQFRVKGTFNKYNRIGNIKGHTARDVARAILDKNGLYDVSVEQTPGELSDHYDPKTRVVRLSQVVYSSTSISAIGVAAHETGHALQHKQKYGPLVLRSSLVPLANVGSYAGLPMALFGFFLGFPMLINLGIVLFSAAVLFYIITLPVEFNASTRAIRTLESTGILSSDEIKPARKVLNAAAMTYVASAAVAIANLLRLVLLASGRRNNE